MEHIESAAETAAAAAVVTTTRWHAVRGSILHCVIRYSAMHLVFIMQDLQQILWLQVNFNYINKTDHSLSNVV